MSTAVFSIQIQSAGKITCTQGTAEVVRDCGAVAKRPFESPRIDKIARTTHEGLPCGQEVQVREKDLSVNSASLRKIPQLVNCPRWDQVEFLGRLNYRTDRATYDGGLVKYEGKLYYVNKAQIESIRGMLRWNVKRVVTVIG